MARVLEQVIKMLRGEGMHKEGALLLIVRVGFENQGYEKLGALTSRMGKPGKLIGQDLQTYLRDAITQSPQE